MIDGKLLEELCRRYLRILILIKPGKSLSKKLIQNNGRTTPNHMHINRPCRTSMHSFKMSGGKLEEELSPQGIYSYSNQKSGGKSKSRKSRKSWHKIMGGQFQNHMHIYIQYRRSMHSFKMIRGKLLEELRTKSTHSNSNLTWKKKLSRKSW